MMLLSLVAALGPTPSTNLVPSAQACRVAFRRAVSATPASTVPVGCWSMGPIALGMAELDVTTRLGTPAAAQEADARHRYRTLLYAFRAPPPRPGAVAVRLVELRFAVGRLVAIDTSPGARIEGAPCSPKRASATTPSVTVDALAGPPLRFAGIGTGDPVSSIARFFGRPPSANGSHDWLNYLPLPVSFTVDPERGRIDGIAIATDDDALTAGALPRLVIRRHGAGCRAISVHYSLPAR